MKTNTWFHQDVFDKKRILQTYSIHALRGESHASKCMIHGRSCVAAGGLRDVNWRLCLGKQNCRWPEHFLKINKHIPLSQIDNGGVATLVYSNQHLYESKKQLVGSTNVVYDKPDWLGIPYAHASFCVWFEFTMSMFAVCASRMLQLAMLQLCCRGSMQIRINCETLCDWPNRISLNPNPNCNPKP